MKRLLVIHIVVIGFLITIVSFRRSDKDRPYVFPQLEFFPNMPTATGNVVTVFGAEVGRYLFYDPILSLDSTIACASCHKQNAAFSGGPDQFSKGFNGVLQRRNTLPLFNLAWYSSFFWDGRAGSIEEQVFSPVRDHHEMNLAWPVAVGRINKSRFYKQAFVNAFGKVPIDSMLVAKAIAQFERTLLSYRSKYDRVLNGTAYFSKDETDGFVLINDMTRGDCLHCHITDGDALGTSLEYSNNGLDTASNYTQYKDKGVGEITGNIADYGKFKIPSLRNIMVTAPYMHDGRFKTIEKVLDFYSSGVQNSVNIDGKMGFVHQGGVQFTEEEKKKIISFLATLTDSAFISDPAFSNPFRKE